MMENGKGVIVPVVKANDIWKGERLLTTDEVGERLGLGICSVRRIMLRGELPTVKVGAGRAVRIPASAVDRYIAERVVATTRK